MLVVEVLVAWEQSRACLRRKGFGSRSDPHIFGVPFSWKEPGHKRVCACACVCECVLEPLDHKSIFKQPIILKPTLQGPWDGAKPLVLNAARKRQAKRLWCDLEKGHRGSCTDAEQNRTAADGKSQPAVASHPLAPKRLGPNMAAAWERFPMMPSGHTLRSLEMKPT